MFKTCPKNSYETVIHVSFLPKGSWLKVHRTSITCHYQCLTNSGIAVHRSLDGAQTVHSVTGRYIRSQDCTFLCRSNIT